MSDTWLSVIGGGFAAALVTLIFNALWDRKKQKIAEDWEFKRYQANQIHLSTAGLLEVYFSAKNELYYLTGTLESLAATLNQLTTQADQIVRQYGGPQLTVAELEQRKQALLEPFQKFNQEQVNMRWGQFEQKSKDNHTKAELHLTTLKSLIPTGLHEELMALFARLSEPFQWDLPRGKDKLALLEAALPEVLTLREKLMRELEKKLDR